MLLGFRSGGFFPGPVAAAGIVLVVLLAVRAVAAPPAAALSAGYVAGAAALALLAAWTLLSARWSHAPARALTEYDRALLVAVGFVLAGSLGRSARLLRWTLRGVAAAAVVVCVCGLITRLAPDLWPIDPGISPDRLSYPLSYWNALGLLAAVGIVLSFALTCDDRESPAVRVLAAAALPALAATLLLTYSRGAIAAGAVGVLVMLLAARPRALLAGAIAALPAGIAVTAAYRADLLASEHPATVAATAQGHGVALAVAASMIAAAALRWPLLELDQRVAGMRAPAALRRPAVRVGVALTAVLVAVAVALAAGAPAAVQRQYDRFVAGDEVAKEVSSTRDRLTNPGNNGRIDAWRVALDAFAAEPLHGRGAGTYALEWDRRRPQVYQLEDAHSLYLETLAELGVVGLALLLAALVAVLAGFGAQARGPDRVVGGAFLGAGVAWALHAGVDWDWEMPAVTFWLFAAGGLALAAPRDRARPLRASAVARAAVALCCLVLAIVPARLFLSDRPLRESARAFARGDCATAIDRALDASSLLDLRPEPFVLLGYCDARIGRTDLAERAMHNAVRRDPGNWEGYYGLALVRAAGGRDPHRALRDARRLNPREPLLFRARRLFASRDPEVWRRRALRAPLVDD